MHDTAIQSTKRVLEPSDRVSEVLFGLIMVLTFTGSISVADGGAREDVQAMLIGAIGCNIAWGIVDAVMYLMSSMTERARVRAAMRALREATNPTAARRCIADAMPTSVASVVTESELESIRQRLIQMPEPPPAPLVHKDEWLGALGVFLLVFLCTFPVVLPFMFMDDARLALRVSNLIAIVMLFFCGYSLGKFARGNPWVVGLVMVLLGTALAAMTLALGG